ncbi:MAG: tRNA epoxyqueuosine(34) reductase QueG, partial [Bacteroidota bacterium]
MSKSPAQISQHIKQKAQQFGFAFCGISEAGFLEEEAPRLEAWLNSNQ